MEMEANAGLLELPLVGSTAFDARHGKAREARFPVRKPQLAASQGRDGERLGGDSREEHARSIDKLTHQDKTRDADAKRTITQSVHVDTRGPHSAYHKRDQRDTRPL